MESVQGTAERRAQLDEWMNEYRLMLRMKWIEVARRARMSPQNLVRIRKGQISISWDAADGIEDAFQWERGSVEAAVNHGRPPVPRSTPTASAATDDDEIPPGWTDEEEQSWTFARSALTGLRANLTRRRWRRMRVEYESLAAMERSSNPDHAL